MNGGCTDRFLALSFQVIWLLRLSGWCHRVPACILAESLASCTPLVLLPKLFSLESAPLLDFGATGRSRAPRDPPGVMLRGSASLFGGG